MENGPSGNDLVKARALRRCIMITLYQFFTDYPYASMEMNHLHDTCGSSPRDLNWNIVYLEKSGYVELSRSTDCQPYVSCSVSITGIGVDLVEDTTAFYNRFPLPVES